MESTRRLARRAGLLYWLQCQPAPFAYLYVPGVLLARQDALATAERVRASEGLLRAAIVGELFSATVSVFSALLLYELFKGVNGRRSAFMAAMMLISVPISYVNAVVHAAPIVLLKNSAISAALDPAQVAALVTLFLRLHNYGLVVGQIFWGLWLLPWGLLVLRCGFIPPWIAYPMFVAGVGYVLNSLGVLLLPPALRAVTDRLQVLGIGELPITFWLLFWGARSQTSPVARGDAGAGTGEFITPPEPGAAVPRGPRV